MIGTLLSSLALSVAGRVVKDVLLPEVVAFCAPVGPFVAPDPSASWVRDVLGQFVGFTPRHLDRQLLRLAEQAGLQGSATREEVGRLRDDMRGGFEALHLGQKRILAEVRQARLEILQVWYRLDAMESKLQVLEVLAREQQVARNFTKARNDAQIEGGLRLQSFLDLHGILVQLAECHEGMNFRALGFPHQRGHQGPPLVALAPDVASDLDQLYWLLNGLRTAAAFDRNQARVTTGVGLRGPDPIRDYVPGFDQQVVMVDAFREARRHAGDEAVWRLAHELGPANWRYWAAFDLYRHKQAEYDRCRDLEEVGRLTRGHYEWWLWRTHMGLLHRTIREIEEARAGYPIGDRGIEGRGELVICADVGPLLLPGA